MKEGPDIAHIAALIGDPARSNMLTALMSGKALTVSELAAEAGVTLQTTSAHLSKLEAGGLISPRKQGRHKYFTLANEGVALVLEGLMGLAAGTGHLRKRTGPKDAQLRKARLCYNHLAGDMGTRLYDSFLSRDFLLVIDDEPILNPKGRVFLQNFGIDFTPLDARKTPLCRSCLDWSERRFHLAGSLGRALMRQFEDLKWAKRDPTTRVVTFSKAGEQEFETLLIAT
ncbi:MAG: winged helix-turn-helix domain-containing protein [Aliishimia sp.]